MIYLLGLNLDIKDARNEAESVRFQTAVEAIKQIHKPDNKIVIMSHRGRPQGRDPKLSLSHFKEDFDQALGAEVIFVDNLDLDKAKNEIENSPNGSVLLLENSRFLNGETTNDLELAKKLASLGDIYVNDDFATAHRENASNVVITKFINHQMGENMKLEIQKLSKAIEAPEHPFIFIIGGVKIADKIGVINNLLPKVDYILLGGGSANTFLKAGGMDIGSSVFEPEMLETARELLKSNKVIIPTDWKKDGDRILDIGPETIKKYKEIISRAKTIIWGGPMGLFEDERFAEGSYEIAKAIAASSGFSIIGGGETAKIVTDLKIKDKIDLVSTGGGAMLDFLSGKPMPALEALRKLH